MCRYVSSKISRSYLGISNRRFIKTVCREFDTLGFRRIEFNFDVLCFEIDMVSFIFGSRAWKEDGRMRNKSHSVQNAGLNLYRTSKAEV